MPFVTDGQRFRIIAAAAAHFAHHVNVRKKIHFDAAQAVALARFAAPALHVEAEAAGAVAALARFRKHGEEIADGREDAGVSGGIRARGAADGSLIDLDDFVDLIGAEDFPMSGGGFRRAVEPLRERAIENVVDECGLAGTRNACDDGEQSKRQRNVHILQIIRARAKNLDGFAVGAAALFGDGDFCRAAQVLTGEGGSGGFDLRRFALGDEVAAGVAGAGAKVDDEISAADGVFAPIRDLFAMLPESRERGYRAGRFSFNVKGGRCEACQGDGLRRIEMNFLPDVYVMCEVCRGRGRRYNSETLAVRYKGHSISDVLNLPSVDALKLLENIPQIQQKLSTLVEVGLGYVTLGQSATTLSGGEAQRIKLARELSKRQTGRTLYILDEPTTGLHFDDVRKLLDVLQRLVDLGNSVLIIEHHLDVIKQADWIIDLGPEGGEGGGRIVAQGTPELVARTKKSYTGLALARVLSVQTSGTNGKGK